MPGTRTMFSPSPTASSSAARSPGVHTAPRQKTRTPLTQRSRESSDRFSMVRKPTRPTTSPSTATSWSRGVPWVCGHHSSTSGNSTRRRRRPRPRRSFPRARPQAVSDPRSGDQRDRPVRPHHRWTGREAGSPAEQLGADPAQPRLLDEHRPPALPWLAWAACRAARSAGAPRCAPRALRPRSAPRCRSNIDRPERTTVPSTSRSQTVAMPPTSSTPAASADAVRDELVA